MSFSDFKLRWAGLAAEMHQVPQVVNAMVLIAAAASSAVSPIKQMMEGNLHAEIFRVLRSFTVLPFLDALVAPLGEYFHEPFVSAFLTFVHLSIPLACILTTGRAASVAFGAWSIMIVVALQYSHLKSEFPWSMQLHFFEAVMLAFGFLCCSSFCDGMGLGKVIIVRVQAGEALSWVKWFPSGHAKEKSDNDEDNNEDNNDESPMRGRAPRVDAGKLVKRRDATPTPKAKSKPSSPKSPGSRGRGRGSSK